MEAIKIKRGVP